MGIWKSFGVGFVVLVGFGLVAGKSIRATQPKPPPQTEDQQAIEQCTVAMWLHYGHSNVSGPGSDVWHMKRAGGIAALYTVRGQNAFSMPVINTIECETAPDGRSGWKLPYTWNVTLHGDRLDPSSLDEHASRSKRPKRASSKAPEQPVQYDASGAEIVTATPATK